MRANRPNGKMMKGTMVLASAAVIGVTTLLFQGFTQAATYTAFDKSNTVPTRYASYAAGTTTGAKNAADNGYRKANYKVGDIDLEYYKSQKPTSKDLSKAEAAEIGARALWDIFQVDLEGQVIELGYRQADESFPRSSWYADVLIDGKLSYYFFIDSVTGELFIIGQSRTLKENASIAFDPKLDKNPQEFEALAKEVAEKFNVVNGEVKEAKYNGQGYSNNDPRISVDVIGTNGEIALIGFSRYDKALLSIGYPAEYKASKEANEKYVKKVQKMVEELEKTGALSDGPPTLRTLHEE